MNKTYFFFTLFCMILVWGCRNDDDETPLSGVEVIVDYDLVKTHIVIKCIDANSEELLANQLVELKITGENAGEVIDFWGAKPAKFRTDQGIIHLALNPNASAPSSTNRKSFSILAEADGYISTGQFVRIYDEGIHQVLLFMVNENNPPEGVSIADEQDVSNAGQNGVLENEIAVSTPNEGINFTIPSGSALKDEAGVPLEGSIDVFIAHFENTTEEALRSYPGGFSTLVNTSNEGLSEGMFVTAGFAAIEVTDQTGRRAHIIEQGSASLIMDIPAETTNPVSESPVAAGDEVGLYSYDEEEGRWKEEASLLIQQDDDDLSISAELEHLSWYNIDWFLSFQSSGGDLCYDDGIFLSFDFRQEDFPCMDTCGTFIGNMYLLGTTQYIGTFEYYLCDGDLYYLSVGAENTPVSIDWQTDCFNYQLSPAFDPTIIPDLCEPVGYSTEIIPQDKSDCNLVTVNVSCTCPSNPNALVLYTGMITLDPTAVFGGASGCAYYQLYKTVEVNQGQFTVSIAPGTYGIWGFYDGDYFYETFTVEPGEIQEVYDIQVDLPEDVCNELGI